MIAVPYLAVLAVTYLTARLRIWYSQHRAWARAELRHLLGTCCASCAAACPCESSCSGRHS